MENSVRKREWVKTAAIIFLAVLLVLTFFSKTIMNASLPEVAAQQAASGAINARIRGSGTVEASEVYNVTIKQTRKVASVLVKTGQEINVGDTMFVLEAEDSDDLKQAETDLETLQQNYDKSLIEAGNTAAQENYDVQRRATPTTRRWPSTASTARWMLRSSPPRRPRPTPSSKNCRPPKQLSTTS